MATNSGTQAGFDLSAFAKADELKKRLLFTIGALIIYRLGTFIPLPGIDPIAPVSYTHLTLPTMELV